MEKSNSTTKQVKGKGKLKNGNPINVAAQFGQPNGNPRHNGAWKKEDSARFKLEQMLKLSEAELRDIATDKEAPLFERKLANCIATGKWKEIEGMMNQVYGQPKQLVENHNIEYKPLVDLTKRKKNGRD
ncbi:hypothetical protein IJ098_00430 [Candidatus Saccharibacteria bacterium]|nr:hypothetical protein [Candidatus Saccharibacteria bacterium]